MIDKEKYLKARDIVNKYESQEFKQTLCFVLYRSSDSFSLVTTDKDYAERMSEREGFIIMKSTLIDLK